MFKIIKHNIYHWEQQQNKIYEPYKMIYLLQELKNFKKKIIFSSYCFRKLYIHFFRTKNFHNNFSKTLSPFILKYTLTLFLR